jgi:hypothetical protein
MTVPELAVKTDPTNTSGEANRRKRSEFEGC